jgi:hypothetical protein
LVTALGPVKAAQELWKKIPVLVWERFDQTALNGIPEEGVLNEWGMG